MKSEPLEEMDFPEALDAFLAAHGEKVHAVVLQSFGEGPEFLTQGGTRAGLFWDSADGFPMYTVGHGEADQILWIKWDVMGQSWSQPVRDFDKGEVFTDAQVCRKKPD
jgi:hypothetical protein